MKLMRTRGKKKTLRMKKWMQKLFKLINFLINKFLKLHVLFYTWSELQIKWGMLKDHL